MRSTGAVAADLLASLDTPSSRPVTANVTREGKKMTAVQRNSLIAALLLLLVLTAMFAFKSTDAEIYRTTKDARALKSVLQNQVAANDSYDEICALLGEGSIERIDADHPYLEWQRTGKMVPDTYRIGDLIVTYDVAAGSAPCLNFRNGRLIHFDVRNFNGVGVTYTAMNSK